MTSDLRHETLNFSYESVGNFIRLLSTINFENTHDSEDIAIWHERFDNDESDDLFESFLEKLFPEGKTIEAEDVETIMNYAEHFLETDIEARRMRANYRKITYGSYVYFKPDINVIYAEVGKHADIVQRICIDYFKDFDHDYSISPEMVKKFILNYFEVKSDNSTLEKIANDCDYIATCISLRRSFNNG